MIRQLTGTVVGIRPLSLTLEVGGIGYLVYTPGITAQFTLGETYTLHTYLAVRETALDLYGFRTPEELEMFELLIGLPKIGPKSAVQIMSHADVELLRKAAHTGDASYLSKISGIGKKSAEKIVVGLRDKLGESDLIPGEYNEGDSDVIDALTTLGYTQKESRDTLKRLPPELVDTNQRIREALKLLSR